MHERKSGLSGTGDYILQNRAGSSCRSDPIDEVVLTLKGTCRSDPADEVAVMLKGTCRSDSLVPTLKRTKEFKSAIGCT